MLRVNPSNVDQVWNVLLIAEVIVCAFTSDLAVLRHILALARARQPRSNGILARLRRLWRETVGHSLIKLLDSLILLAWELLRHIHATDSLLSARNQLPIVSYRHFLTLDVLEYAHIVLLVGQLLLAVDGEAAFLVLRADVMLLWRLDEWQVDLLHVVLGPEHDSRGGDIVLVGLEALLLARNSEGLRARGLIGCVYLH